MRTPTATEEERITPAIRPVREAARAVERTATREVGPWADAGRIALASWVLVGLGIAARVAQYCYCRSLRFDEAKLALNVIDRPLGRLHETLDDLQAAPPGFLWGEHLAYLLLGGGERALRLLPLVCGVAAVVLFRKLALDLLAPGAALLAIAILSLGGELIFYSNDVKQYSGDVLATVAILCVAAGANLRAPRFGAMLRLLVTGAIALAFSHPAAFVLGGVSIAGLLDAARRRDGRAFASLALVAGGWLSAFLAFLALSLGTADEEGLRAFWGKAFLPFPPATLDDWLWYAKYPVKMFRDPGSLQPAPVIALIFGLGCWSLRRRVRWLAVVTIAALLLPLAASALHLYPFKDRFLLFLLPLLALATAEGVTSVSALADRLRPRAWRTAAIAAAAAMVAVPPALTALPAFFSPRTRHVDMASAVDAIADGARPGDLLCSSFEEPAVQTYYLRRAELARLGVENRPIPACDEIAAIADDRSPQRSLRGRRIWFLFRATPPRDTGLGSRPARTAAAEHAVIRAYVDSIASAGQILERRSWEGVELCLARF